MFQQLIIYLSGSYWLYDVVFLVCCQSLDWICR